ncbi:S-adenosyl-L-methionine-dependent methyltransferase [Podospora aff. communis PSN243]|uniref:S-adenosyl-L-methionine-dependent methyltransferase n=1 Tax=Podospora aff. communis PSN243 TaxID=3040156 RepID=A0AAV9H177_9PEZI|nr:S-adenosyl-L-methionine-dependent methyltransferase [Podospora aff. communis PSN243]
MADDVPPAAQRDVTSDYEPSQDGSVFGSLSSSVKDHVWEYGRRYHMFKYGRYPLPNDEEEFKRESLRHTMLKELLHGKLYFAPIGSHPQKIIDLGTGFGEWAIEVGETFPSATIVGVDLSPIQPVWIPPNVEFLVDDIEDDWVYASDFDFVHLRFTGITIKDNATLQQSIFQNLKPGGWVEYQDIYPEPGSEDNSMPADYAVRKFYALCVRVFRNVYNFELDFVKKLPESLQSQGFANVQHKVFHVPIGDWPKDQRMRTIGGYLREVLMNFASAMAARPFVEFGMEKAEIDELVSSLRDSLSDRSIHAYLPIHYVWGQKL